jgi:hypothetical protein
MVSWPTAPRSISTTARMLVEVPGSVKEGVTPEEVARLVREDIVLETVSCPSPSSVFHRTLGGGLLILLLERKDTDNVHWCFFLPGVGFWDRQGEGAKPPDERIVYAWLDALRYKPCVHHAYTPAVVRLGKKWRYVPNSLLQCGKGKGIHGSVSRLPRVRPTPSRLKLKVGRWGTLNYVSVSRLPRVPPTPSRLKLKVGRWGTLVDGEHWSMGNNGRWGTMVDGEQWSMGNNGRWGTMNYQYNDHECFVINCMTKIMITNVSGQIHYQYNDHEAFLGPLITGNVHRAHDHIHDLQRLD